MTNKNTKRDKRAVIFLRARVSPYDGAAVADHLEHQRRQCHQSAAELNATVVREYAIIGGTTNHHTHDALQAMLRELDRDGIDYVIVTSLDRVSRNHGELAKIRRQIRSRDALLVAADIARSPMEQDCIALMYDACTRVLGDVGPERNTGAKGGQREQINA